MEQEKGFTQQQSVKPVCYPRASLVSRPLEKTCPAEHQHRLTVLLSPLAHGILQLLVQPQSSTPAQTSGYEVPYTSTEVLCLLEHKLSLT